MDWTSRGLPPSLPGARTFSSSTKSPLRSSTSSLNAAFACPARGSASPWLRSLRVSPTSASVILSRLSRRSSGASALPAKTSWSPSSSSLSPPWSSSLARFCRMAPDCLAITAVQASATRCALVASTALTTAPRTSSPRRSRPWASTAVAATPARACSTARWTRLDSSSTRSLLMEWDGMVPSSRRVSRERSRSPSKDARSPDRSVTRVAAETGANGEVAERVRERQI
mmetsp:Transcript_8570/g.24434  ORF Transcript_8570/g.24434 Transcript_8570/m.24434 type:complete len:228 (-) Transcript_8570:1363-2046(-)